MNCGRRRKAYFADIYEHAQLHLDKKFGYMLSSAQNQSCTAQSPPPAIILLLQLNKILQKSSPSLHIIQKKANGRPRPAVRVGGVSRNMQVKVKKSSSSPIIPLVPLSYGTKGLKIVYSHSCCATESVWVLYPTEKKREKVNAVR